MDEGLPESAAGRRCVIAGADLVFRIFARDDGASRAFKNLARAADDASDRIMGMRKSTLALAAAQAAPLAAPVAASMLALSGAMAEGAAGMAVVKVAMVGMGDAFRAVGSRDMAALDEAMKKLPPQAVGLVREFQKVAPQLTAIRKAVQGQMFAPLELSIHRLTSSYVPMLSKQMPALARQIGIAGANFAHWAVTAPVLGAVQKIIAHTGTDMQILTRVVQNATQAWLTLASTALPFTRNMLLALERGSAGWRDWVAQAQRAGQLDKLFGRTSETMNELGHTLSLLGQILADVFANPSTVQAATNLIGVLNLALQVVAGLTNAFASLPDGIQVAVLSMAGMYLVLRQVAAAFTVLTLVGARAIGSLTVGMVGLTRAVKAGHVAQSMVAMSSKVGIAAGAVAGLGYGLMLLGEQAIKPTEHSVSKLADSLVDLGRSAKVAGEASRVIGQDMSVLFGLMDRIKNVRISSNASSMITGFVGKPKDVQAVKQLAQNFHEIDQALTQLMQNGQANEANSAFARLRDTWVGSGRSVGELTSKFPTFAEAQRTAATAAAGAGKGFGTMSEKTRVMTAGLADAVREGRKLTDVFTLLNGGMIAFDRAQLAATEATMTAMEAFKEHGRALEGDSIAAQRNRVNVASAAEAWVAAAQAKYEQTDSIEQAQAVWVKDRAAMIASARATGFSKAQIAALTAAIGQMPAMKAPKISTPGAVAAKTQVATLDSTIKTLKGKLAKIDVVGPVAANTEVGRLREQIRNLESKRIFITTEFKVKGRGSNIGWGVGGVATGGLIRKFAGGGFNGRVIGPGTGTSDSVPKMLSNGEFVVKASSVKTVGVPAMEALNKTGRLPVAGSNQPTHIYLHLTGDDPEMLRRLRKMVRIEGGGDVQLAFGR